MNNGEGLAPFRRHYFDTTSDFATRINDAARAKGVSKKKFIEDALAVAIDSTPTKARGKK